MPPDNGRPPLDPFAGVPDRSYEVRAEEIVKPLMEPGGTGLRRWRRQTSNAPIVQVEDAYITGRFDLRAAELDYLFRFERCRFEFPPDVREATLLGLVFRKCWLPGLKARNMRSRNDVRLIRSAVQVPPNARGDSETTVRRANDADRGMPDAAVNLTDAVVEGSVVLTRTLIEHSGGKALQADRLVITGALLAYRLQAAGEIRIPGMKCGGNVNFSGATLDNPGGFALNGNGIHIGGSLLCEVDNYGRAAQRRRFTATGVVFLPSATVDSDIVLRGAQLNVDHSKPVEVEAWSSGDPYVDPRPALVADRVTVAGNVELSDRLQAFGTLRMINARIGGSLRMAGAYVEVPRGEAEPFYDRAVHLDGSEIRGDVEATGLRVRGQARLTDVTVGGNVRASRSSFVHARRDAFAARRSRISGNLDISNARFNGTLRLQGVEVGGNINLYGTQLSDPAISLRSSFSVDLRTVRVGRDVLLTNNRDRGFWAEGGVTMDGATVGRRVNLEGGALGSLNQHAIALDAGDLGADELVLTPGRRPVGRVVLRRAHCGTLDDNPVLWEATGGIEVEDFRYDALSEPVGLKDDDAVAERLRLLRNAMRGYRPGPYDQLAGMLRSSGNEEHADTVLLRKQQYRYEALSRGHRLLGPGVRLWSWLQRWMVGYGYRPVRAVTWLLALLVLGTIYFGLTEPACAPPYQYAFAGGHCLVNTDDTGLQWNPVLYTVDLLVPIVDFGNKGRWQIDGPGRWVATGFTAMGWILATTVAAGVTRTLRRNGG